MSHRLAAIGLAVLALAGVGCGSDEKDTGGSGSGSGSGSTVKDASSAAAGPADVSFVVAATDYAFALPTGFAIKAGQRVNLVLDNQGKAQHELEVFDPAGKVLGEIKPVDGGKKDAGTFPFTAVGTYKFVCGVADHEARGMVTSIAVS